MIKKPILLLSFVCLVCAPTLYGQTILKAEENETIELNLSRNDFNRLFVENDKITKLRFPEGYLSVENDKDGSVYLDVKDDRAFTLFVTTESGKHFSATIKVSESPGQTIGVAATYPTLAQATIKHNDPTKKNNINTAYEKELVALVGSVEKEEQRQGFKAQKPAQREVAIQPYLTSTLVYTLSDSKRMGQKFKITNKGNTPVSFEDKWFKDKDTKALLVKERVVYPHESITVVRIEEGVKHG